MNILFLMVDQLRFDYLGCTGHPSINTPNIDALANRGVRFDRAYVQSPLCGPSRMSTYTGRYCHSHGATWNGTPLRVGEMTLGDHLRPLGVETVLCGKTHAAPDVRGMERLGIDPKGTIGRRIAECGFDVWERMDGEFPAGLPDLRSSYQDYLHAKGYVSDNPWHDFANSGVDEFGNVLSGWQLQNSTKPARIAKEDSETAWLTARAMEFLDQAGDTPWCLHVSYIKPHWPYVAPAPYHEMYGPDDIKPVVRSNSELADPHPVLAAFQDKRVGKAFSRPEVRAAVIPAYMGLITEIDDQIGRLTAHLDSLGQRDNTLIVFTSDHGDYLGDHWLGEKELFHDASVRVPLIVVDPGAAADETRGTVCPALVEAIDLVPTFVDYAGGEPRGEILEGHSLRPLVAGQAAGVRDHVISEYDYSFKSARGRLNQRVGDCRLAMIYDGRFKLVHAEGFRPMLFDLHSDPDELSDLGDSVQHVETCDRLTARLNAWFRQHHNKTMHSDAEILARENGDLRRGIFLGFWDQDDMDEAARLGRTGN